MRTVNIDLFKANELSERALAVALNDYREINLDREVWINTFQDEADALGIILTRDKIDGFTDELSEVVAKILDTYPVGSSGFALGTKYEYTFTSKYFPSDVEEFKADLYSYYMGNIDKIFKEKREAMTSDEAVMLTLINNQYEFTSNGILYTVITEEEWREVDKDGPRVTILQI